MTTTELLNTMIDRASNDGLPDLAEILACTLNLDDAPELPLAVGQVAELLNMSSHTLRYYERIGLVTVDRTSSGHRQYDLEAIGRVLFITRLRLSGMSISDITDYIALVETGDSTVDERLALLCRHRDKIRRQLEELKFTMAVIDYKITVYGGTRSD
ncbi:MerR family transcriptional regulator [Fodinicola feengrottensis]|uniref:MerR family transcriptional regulator n=1 Tax=Fodinicola feengrottensis TaxID=435914 RepID=A0ABP4U2U1_9ACTN|nr:MerR family transcriptional regulator [Fodinicola feengrottensis]